MSVPAKRTKLNPVNKRTNESEEKNSKRHRTEYNEDSEIKKIRGAKKRKNFITACEQVSCKSYFDVMRFQIIYLPECRNAHCKHKGDNGIITKEVPYCAEEAFRIEISKNMWNEALEICQMSIKPSQYLTVYMLMNVVEIMMNAHENSCQGHSIIQLIEKCQLILALNFSAHPPCAYKNMRKCYNKFLTSPMDLKEKTFTNRKMYDSDKGIVKYCLTRLEYEIGSDSKDEPLVNQSDHIPEEFKQSVKGLHWQKGTLEIYETLNRVERIKRIMAVLESVVELLQFDLAMWHSRYANNSGGHLLRSHKPLMAQILWSHVLYTGTVNVNCRQILKLFAYLIHLQYPEEYIKIMTSWLTVMVQTYYFCEKNSNCDYPNFGKYSTTLAKEFYKIIKDLPHKSIISIIEKINPTYMQYLVGSLHVKMLLSTEEDNIINLLINFLQNEQWSEFPKGDTEIKLSKSLALQPKITKNVLSFLEKMCHKSEFLEASNHVQGNVFRKFYNDFNADDEVNQNTVVHILYVTLAAYLDAYSFQTVQDELEKLNEQEDNVATSMDIEIADNSTTKYSPYFVTEEFIKIYRSIFRLLKELMALFVEMKNKEHFPKILEIFGKMGLLS